MLKSHFKICEMCLPDRRGPEMYQMSNKCIRLFLKWQIKSEFKRIQRYVIYYNLVVGNKFDQLKFCSKPAITNSFNIFGLF